MRVAKDAKRNLRYPTDEELLSVGLVREITDLWGFTDDAEKLKLVQMLAFIAGSADPDLGKRVKGGQFVDSTFGGDGKQRRRR